MLATSGVRLISTSYVRLPHLPIHANFVSQGELEAGRSVFSRNIKTCEITGLCMLARACQRCALERRINTTLDRIGREQFSPNKLVTCLQYLRISPAQINQKED